MFSSYSLEMLQTDVGTSTLWIWELLELQKKNTFWPNIVPSVHFFFQNSLRTPLGPAKTPWSQPPWNIQSLVAIGLGERVIISDSISCSLRYHNALATYHQKHFFDSYRIAQQAKIETQCHTSVLYPISVTWQHYLTDNSPLHQPINSSKDTPQQYGCQCLSANWDQHTLFVTDTLLVTPPPTSQQVVTPPSHLHF